MTAQDKTKVPIAKPIGKVADAAADAAEAFGKDELEKHAKAVRDAWKAILQQQTKQYVRKGLRLAQALRAQPKKRGEGLEIAEPIALPPGLPPYPWWNVLLAGPFQPGISPTPSLPPGPYLPHKIIAVDEPAFILAAVWRNPAGIDWNGTNPSAATIMSAFDLTIWFETLNITNVVNGPDFGPFTFSPLGPGVVDVVFVPLPAGTFPAPPDGKPNLYELNMTADVSGPVAGLPFAGFATWVWDPDLEPPIWPPPLPSIPPVIPTEPLLWWWPPHWQFERPARFMVYTA